MNQSGDLINLLFIETKILPITEMTKQRKVRLTPLDSIIWWLFDVCFKIH